MRSKIFAGTTSLAVPIYVSNSSAGGGLGSLVFNTSGLVGEYRRAGSSSWTSITLSAGTLGTWSSGGWIADGSLTGAYEVGIPNAALASGEPWVAVRFYGATNMTPVLLYFELDAVNYQSTSLGLSLAKTTNITGFNDIAATAIVSAGAITTSSGKVSEVVLVDTLTTYTGNTVQTGDAYARLGSPAGASVSADVAAIKSDTGTILTDVNTGAGAIYTRLGAPTGASIAADIQTRLPTSSYTTPPTAAAIATAVLTDTGDNTTTGSPGKILAQLLATFTTTTSSIFSSAALANAPSGGNVTVGGYATGQDPATLVLSAVLANFTTSGTVGAALNLLPSIANPGDNPIPAFPFFMTLSPGGGPALGVTVTAQRVLNGGALTLCDNAPTETGSGLYQIDLTSNDLNATTIAIIFSAASCNASVVTLIRQT